MAPEQGPLQFKKVEKIILAKIFDDEKIGFYLAPLFLFLRKII